MKRARAAGLVDPAIGGAVIVREPGGALSRSNTFFFFPF